MKIFAINENNNIIFTLDHFKAIERKKDKFLVYNTNGDIHNFWNSPHIKEIKISL